MQYAGIREGSSLIRFDQAVKWHNISAIILVVNYGFFVIGNAISKNGRYYRIKKEGFLNDLGVQLKYYTVGMFRNEKHPFEVNEENKFNPLQKIAYVTVIYLFMPLLIISGFALLFPEIIVRQIFNVSGLLLTDLVHVCIGFLLSIFMIIHIYTCTLGKKPGTLFKSMINGYHEHHD
jgi:thiosulfate reductase cytochrome b subunit